MNPQDIIAEGREKIIAELNLGHLPTEEQDHVLDTLGDVLIRRMIIKVLALLPDGEKQKFEELFVAQQNEALEALINKNIPNAREVMMQEVRDGVEEYKKRVNAIIAERESAPAPAV